jgi:type VI secretion system protein ImpA
VTDQASWDRLLAPVSEDVPCGADLEYDPAFIELQTTAAGKPEQQFGDKIIPGEEPDWRVVASEATALLERSKDLRVAALLVRSQTRLGGLAGFVQGLRWLEALMRQYWPGLHPVLDADDDNDPTMRVSALQTLADAGMLVADLREAQVVVVRGIGPLRVRDIEAAVGGGQGRSSEQSLTQEQVLGGLSEVVAQQPSALDAVLEAVPAIMAFQSAFNELCGRGDLLDLTPLRRPAYTLQQLCQPLRQQAAQGAEGTSAAEGGEAVGDAPPATGGGVALATRGIATREDAIRMLDKVIEYLNKAEPSNPAPLLIQRAKRLIGADFMAIMADLAPDAVGAVEHISGRRRDDDN